MLSFVSRSRSKKKKKTAGFPSQDLPVYHPPFLEPCGWQNVRVAKRSMRL